MPPECVRTLARARAKKKKGKYARILAHVPGVLARSLARSLTRRAFVPGGSLARAGHGRSFPDTRSHGRARVDGDDDTTRQSVRRGGNKFTIYAGRSISICISSKYAGIELRNE